MRVRALVEVDIEVLEGFSIVSRELFYVFPSIVVSENFIFRLFSHTRNISIKSRELMPLNFSLTAFKVTNLEKRVINL